MPESIKEYLVLTLLISLKVLIYVPLWGVVIKDVAVTTIEPRMVLNGTILQQGSYRF